MSWSLLAMPQHVLAEDGMAEWIAQAGPSRGVPDEVPEALPLPSAAAVLDAAAVLRAVCALAQVSGPQLVIDEQADAVFVVWPGEQADVLQEWFW
jgi:hypothetical protein